VEDVSQRAARGLALVTLAIACVVVGPAPQLAQAFERTYAVAVAEDRRRRRHDTPLPDGLVPPSSWRRRTAPSPRRPGPRRP
jgi:hypothetical protein